MIFNQVPVLVSSLAKKQDAPFLGLTDIFAAEISSQVRTFVPWRIKLFVSFSWLVGNNHGYHQKYQRQPLRHPPHPPQCHHQNQCDLTHEPLEEQGDPEDDDGVDGTEDRVEMRVDSRNRHPLLF